MSNRRDFLKNMSLLAAGGIMAGRAGSLAAAPVVSASLSASGAPSATKQLGLQTYSLQKEFFDNLPRRMNELREMGYVNLELAGYNEGKIGQVDILEFKKMADDAGLHIRSSHVNPSIPGVPYLSDYTREVIPQIKEYWKRTADDHAKIGCELLIQPMMPNCRSHEDAALITDIFNESGKIVKAAGLPFGYHNHHMEFQRLIKPADRKKEYGFWDKPGDQIYDLFLRDTDPSLVFFEMDVYWTVMGANDPVEYMRKYPDRIKALHIKDRSVLGQSGMMNFEMIFKQMYANNIGYYFVELEQMPDGRTQFEGVADCAAYLQKASFVK